MDTKTVADDRAVKRVICRLHGHKLIDSVEDFQRYVMQRSTCTVCGRWTEEKIWKPITSRNFNPR